MPQFYKDNDGNVIGVFAAARDITERKRNEKRTLNWQVIIIVV